jgi:hypothetical protein
MGAGRSQSDAESLISGGDRLPALPLSGVSRDLRRQPVVRFAGRPNGRLTTGVAPVPRPLRLAPRRLGRQHTSGDLQRAQGAPNRSQRVWDSRLIRPWKGTASPRSRTIRPTVRIGRARRTGYVVVPCSDAGCQLRRRYSFPRLRHPRSVGATTSSACGGKPDAYQCRGGTHTPLYRPLTLAAGSCV